MIRRDILKSHPVIGKNRILTNPVGTVFRLDLEETNSLASLWGSGFIDSNEVNYSAMEGQTQLKSHYCRERSRKLVALKKEQYKKEYGTLRCEICNLSFEELYPKSLGDNFIEVHHKTPLAQINKVVRTTLNDLILCLCKLPLHDSQNKRLRAKFRIATNAFS